MIKTHQRAANASKPKMVEQSLKRARRLPCKMELLNRNSSHIQAAKTLRQRPVAREAAGSKEVFQKKPIQRRASPDATQTPTEAKPVDSSSLRWGRPTIGRRSRYPNRAGADHSGAANRASRLLTCPQQHDADNRADNRTWTEPRLPCQPRQHWPPNARDHRIRQHASKREHDRKRSRRTERLPEEVGTTKASSDDVGRMTEF